jgi:hypothetical protein
MRCGEPTVEFLAELILEAEIRPVLLDDTSFDAVAGKEFSIAAEAIASTFGLKRPYSTEFYLRASSPHLASDAVHEAAHCMDEQDNTFSPKALEMAYLSGSLNAGHPAIARCVRWIHEVRAFALEREFQLARYPATLGYPQFASVQEIMEYVEASYGAIRPMQLPPHHVSW